MRQEGFVEALASAYQRGEPFAVATVIRVQGSASARAGSKAVLNLSGRNDFGWVGGGCAERFVGDQAIEAIAENQTRIVTAILDDEIFGLGVACGGRMDVFIEPILPQEELSLPRLEGLTETDAQELVRCLNWRISWREDWQRCSSLSEFYLVVAKSLAQSRGKTGRSLRTIKKLPIQFSGGFSRPLSQAQSSPYAPANLVVVGQSRIVEALARFATQLGWPVRVIGTSQVKEPEAQWLDYPPSVIKESLAPDNGYDQLSFQTGDCVVIASHLAMDAKIVDRALAANSHYVGMVGSQARGLEVCEKLNWTAAESLAHPFFLPAGLDLDSRGPEEIAFSVICEILTFTPSSEAK